MEKIKSLLPEIAFAAALIRVVALGAGLGDAVVLLSLAALIGFKSYLNKREEDKYLELQTKLESLTEKLKDYPSIEKKIDELAAQVQTVNLNNSVRRQSHDQIQLQNTQSLPGKRMF